MESTLKISRSGSSPAIKIIQPSSVLNLQESDDYDERDMLLKEFLHAPMMVYETDWFILNTNFTASNGHKITTIVPVDQRELFYKFRHAILNRLVPYETIVAINRQEAFAKPDSPYAKIMEFFDWADKQDWNEFGDSNPKPMQIIEKEN